MKHIILSLILFGLFSCSAKAQPWQQLNTAEILQAMKKLNTAGSVLYIAAHPDDENTRLLGYLAKEKNLRTGYLSLTRGDGGQNLIGKEQGEQLGLIRTQELLAARRTDGAEQFFTRANDFGYSKSPEETFSFWNKDSILGDVVWAIRKFKPDVIICRFPTTGEGGHGHHTASAILALEAFDAAADPKRFPQQLTYTEVWHTKRIFWNTFNFGGTNTTAPDQLKIDVGAYNALLGKGYGEVAAESRSMHKSQGFGSAKTRGSNIEYFKILKGDSVKTDLFEGIDQTINRFNATSKLLKLISNCLDKYDAQHPEKSIPDLLEIYMQLKDISANDPVIKYWRNQKSKETESLILSCAGLWIEAGGGDYTGVPGDSINIAGQIICRNKVDVKLNKINFLNYDTIINLGLKYNELQTFNHKMLLPANFAYSNPYWLNEKHEPGIYTVRNQLLIGKPENDNSSIVEFYVSINGVELKIERGLVYKFTDPVKGEIYRPFEILPPATVNISDKVYVFNDSLAKPIHFVIKANSNNVSGILQATVPAGWTIKIGNPEFKLINKGDETTITGTVIPASNHSEGKLLASVIINNTSYNKSITRIEYDHIPYQFILSDAEAKLVNVNLKKTGTNIGYIAGAGDDVPAGLKQVGYNVTMLTDDLLSNEDLSKYNTIVTGIRAYNTNDRLQAHYIKLMDFVKNGGNLLVQYNTNNRIGPVQAKIGPYPFTISRDRVTNENAPVTMLQPEHLAFNFPNKITSSDFDNWIQERGIYFAGEKDKNYESIISMNDAGEKSNDGSIIIGKYGKGNFVYTGLVFFRELPAGVPGAYRLFVNLISLPANK